MAEDENKSAADRLCAGARPSDLGRLGYSLRTGLVRDEINGNKDWQNKDGGQLVAVQLKAG